ncbi:MBL fold metallo-hydrolase [Planomicrobium okeanokoites]|uniref:MBL fold metallo-hydrolase n=1 Tax=Planomicrobium okeanokoites TaxID=244 RepID=UPI002492FAEC|nr:MBL fold metallo-hydrolase [Planomicrobium okeanokoites]
MKKILMLIVALLIFLAGCQETVAPKKPVEQGESVQESMDPTLTVHYIDVGQGDATLLEFDGHAILIDAGHWKSDQAVDYLKTAGIKAINIAVGTHPDADHIGQLAQIIGEFSVEEVWLPGNPSTSNTYLNVLQAIDASGTDYYEPRAGDVFDVGKMRIDVLYPEQITGAANEESISMKLTYGDIQFVFTGDAGVKEERQMIDSGTDLQAEILHLGHHGSNTSTSSAFLDAVSPEVAIYSAGADNSYGHPHAEVLAAVENSGAEVYGTDVNGTIIVETDGSAYNVVTSRTGIPTEGENRCININIASTAELQQIAGIGETYAKEIIRLRPFEAIEDLDDISGIGQATVDAIKEQNLACVEE